LKTNGNKREAKTLTYKKKTGPRIKYYSSLACEITELVQYETNLVPKVVIAHKTNVVTRIDLTLINTVQWPGKSYQGGMTGLVTRLNILQ
jgi:hypothetical protein